MAFASDRAAKRPCPFPLSGAGHLRSKTAFSRFPPVDRTDLKGWLRVEHAPFAERSGMTAICAFRPCALDAEPPLPIATRDVELLGDRLRRMRKGQDWESVRSDLI